MTSIAMTTAARRIAMTSIAMSSAALTLAVSAEADTAKVALVRESNSGPVRQTMWTRLRAELVAAGFEVTEIEPTEGEPREAGQNAELAPGTFATISVVDREGGALDIWVADRITGKTLVRRVENQHSTSHDAPAILAVRAVELLRASLLEAMDPPPRSASPSSEPDAAPPPDVPVAVTQWMQTQTQTQTQTQVATQTSRAAGVSHFDLVAAAGLLHSLGGVGPAVLPSLGVSYRVTPSFSLGIEWGGPAFNVELPVQGGTIAARQELAWLEARYLFSLGGGVAPFFAAGAGVYHLDVTGTAEAPYRGQSDDLFAALWGGGVGAKIPLSERMAIVFDVHAFVATPRPVVLASGTEVASAVRPALLERAGIDVAF